MTPDTQSATTESSTPDNGQPLAEQAQEKLKDATAQAGEQAQNAAQQARDRAREQVDQRSTEAGQRLKDTAGDARSMADHLRSEGKDGPAKAVEQAAEKVESLGGYLHGADTDKLLRDVEDYGRKNPWAVIAGGIAVGFAASRVLSASSSTRSLNTGQGPTATNGSSGPARSLTAARPADDTPRAAADAATGAPYGGHDQIPHNADLPRYGGSAV